MAAWPEIGITQQTEIAYLLMLIQKDRVSFQRDLVRDEMKQRSIFGDL
jgi:hypothetical protein